MALPRQPPRHPFRNVTGNGTILVEMENVLPFNGGSNRRLFRLPSEIRLHWADPVHTKSDSRIPPLVPQTHTKHRKESFSRPHTYIWGLNISGKVNSETTSNCTQLKVKKDGRFGLPKNCHTGATLLSSFMLCCCSCSVTGSLWQHYE